MKLEQKRIFIDNLPPDIQQKEIEEQFKNYGEVVSVDIKHRKENTNQSSSPVFAFVNIKIDDRSLNTCFREFTDYEWNGYHVTLQLAKESFLERLKREREESNKTKELNKDDTIKQSTEATVTDVRKIDKQLYTKTYHSSSSSSDSDSSSENETEETNKACNKTEVKVCEEKIEDKDFIIKNNKFNFTNGKSLKIESFNKTPIHIINLKQKKKISEDENVLKAEEKRKRSLSLMKNTYNQQKLAIKSALSSIDSKKNNKIVFDDETTENLSKKRKYNNTEYNLGKSNNESKFSLFDGEDEPDDNINFSIKKQFEGQKGQKLLELQSRFTNDKRFTLDSRFNDEDVEQEENDLFEDDEKQKQLEILESVLGKKIISNKPKETAKTSQKPRITMTRFDPSKPEHSKYELKDADVKESKNKKKEKLKQKDVIVDLPKVEVSKDTFYKVKGNLKQSLQENQSFSLLSMFGKAEEKGEIEQREEAELINKTKYTETSNNPFKYDSSDSEDEEDKTINPEKEVLQPQKSIKNTFFFQNNDERLQEVNEFLRKLGTDVKLQPFNEKRRELKKIVRDKIKNNMRNHRPFRKKIGRSKMIKVKKAKKK